MDMAMRDEFVEVFEPTEAPAIQRRERKSVDFSAVPPSQWKIHDRLTNWARWARGSQGQAGQAGSPMFALYRSTEAKRQYGEETSVPVDRDDAMKLAKAIGHLPHNKRQAVHWYYLHPRNPTGKARELGTDLEGLSQLVRDARVMLMGWV